MNKKVKGWGNPYIYVDLNKGTIRKEVINEETRKKFIGGRPLSDWLLFNSVDPSQTNPLGPDNKIYFSSGMFNGRPMDKFPGASRVNMVFLNALTNGYGESSSAGRSAIELKCAGYDGIVISEKSDTPVWLWIDDDKVEIRDAKDLWGKTTFETQEMIKKEIGDENIKISCIGPAGEHLVRYACVNCDNRYSGRGGTGAIWGSKNLKAIAVRGSKEVELANPDRFFEIAEEIYQLLAKEPNRKLMAECGMAVTPEAYNDAGIQGVRNFQGFGFNKIKNIGYDAVSPFYAGVIKCASHCPVNCDRLIKIPEDRPYGGTWSSSWEATPAFNTAHLLINDIYTTHEVFRLCNAYGLDIHSWSNVVQWAIECWERGILNQEDTDKLLLRWGDGPLALDLIKRITYRQGKFGNLLAEGVARASKTLGRDSEKYAMQMKNMEIDDEFRYAFGYALGIWVATRGAAHTTAAYFGEFDAGLTPELSKKLYNHESAGKLECYDDRPEYVVMTERYGEIQDALGVCLYATQRISPQLIDRYNMKTYAELIECVTGWKVSEEELIEIAERAWTTEKALNILAGYGRKDDIPPTRFFEPAYNGEERFNGKKLDREKVLSMIREHDERHGWDPDTGIPTIKTLKKLGLKKVIDKLGKVVKLK